MDESKPKTWRLRIGAITAGAVCVSLLAGAIVLVVHFWNESDEAYDRLETARASDGVEAAALEERAAVIEGRISALRLGADPTTRAAELERLAEASVCESSDQGLEAALDEFERRAPVQFPVLTTIPSWSASLDRGALERAFSLCVGGPA